MNNNEPGRFRNGDLENESWLPFEGSVPFSSSKETVKPGLHFSRKHGRDGKHYQKIYALPVFLFRSPKLPQNTELNMLNFSCFSLRFPCATDNKIRLGSDSPKHKRHGVANQHGVFSGFARS